MKCRTDFGADLFSPNKLLFGFAGFLDFVFRAVFSSL
jgi:hypothetical protein